MLLPHFLLRRLRMECKDEVLRKVLFSKFQEDKQMYLSSTVSRYGDLIRVEAVNHISSLYSKKSMSMLEMLDRELGRAFFVNWLMEEQIIIVQDDAININWLLPYYDCQYGLMILFTMAAMGHKLPIPILPDLLRIVFVTPTLKTKKVQSFFMRHFLATYQNIFQRYDLTISGVIHLLLQYALPFLKEHTTLESSVEKIGQVLEGKNSEDILLLHQLVCRIDRAPINFFLVGADFSKNDPEEFDYPSEAALKILFRIFATPTSVINLCTAAAFSLWSERVILVNQWFLKNHEVGIMDVLDDSDQLFKLFA
jgi:hypothetical protein